MVAADESVPVAPVSPDALGVSPSLSRQLLAALRARVRCVHVYGPAGVGKTHSVRAIVAYAGLPLVTYDASAALTGVSPVLHAMKRAAEVHPSVLLVDHADLLFPSADEQPVEESILEAHRLAAAVAASPVPVTLILISLTRTSGTNPK